MAARFHAARRHARFGVLHVVNDALAVFEKSRAFEGQRDLAGRAHQQFDAEALFERVDAAADDRRRDAFGQSRGGSTLGVQLDVGSRIPIATTAMGRAYLWAMAPDERSVLLRELREHYGSRWPKMRDGIERSGETVARYGFAISAGEWQDDVHAVGVALKLNDGTGPFAFNCGAPAFRFTEDRLRNDIGPRLVAMVRNIEAALGGAAPQSAARGVRSAPRRTRSTEFETGDGRIA